MIAIMLPLYDALAPLLSREIAAPMGSCIFHQGDRVSHLYFVRSGTVQLARYSENGTASIMQRAVAGSLLAESSIFATEYHCSAEVIEEARLERADMHELRRALHKDSSLLEAITFYLAKEVQRTRARLELLGRKTVEERLDGWLALNDGRLPSRGSWRTVADEIGVSPEAFYRELKRRRVGQPSRSRSLK
jgi:CRP-like cAMP-binding protein